MRTIKYKEVRYTRDQIIENLHQARIRSADLWFKKVTPKELIGTGYADPKASAHEYVAERIAVWHTLLCVFDEMEEDSE